MKIEEIKLKQRVKLPPGNYASVGVVERIAPPFVYVRENTGNWQSDVVQYTADQLAQYDE